MLALLPSEDGYGNVLRVSIAQSVERDMLRERGVGGDEKENEVV